MTSSSIAARKPPWIRSTGFRKRSSAWNEALKRPSAASMGCQPSRAEPGGGGNLPATRSQNGPSCTSLIVISYNRPRRSLRAVRRPVAPQSHQGPVVPVQVVLDVEVAGEARPRELRLLPLPVLLLALDQVRHAALPRPLRHCVPAA